MTDNGANFKAAGGLLSCRIPTLYWNPCTAIVWTLKVVVVKGGLLSTASSSQVDASSEIEMTEESVPIILNDDENIDDDCGHISPNSISQRNDEALAQDKILGLYDDF